MYSLLRDVRSTLSRRTENEKDSNSISSKYAERRFAHSSVPALKDGRMDTSFTDIFDSQVDRAEYRFPWDHLGNTQELRNALVAARSDRASQDFKHWERRLEKSVQGALTAYDRNPQNHRPKANARLAIRSAFGKKEASSTSIYNAKWNQSTTHLGQSKRRAIADTFNREVVKAKHRLSSLGPRSSESLPKVPLEARNDLTSQALAGWQDEVRAISPNATASHSFDKHEAVPMLEDHASRHGSTSSSYNKTSKSNRSHESDASSKRRRHFQPTRSSLALPSLSSESKRNGSHVRTRATSVALTSALKNPRSCRRRPDVHVHFKEDPVTSTVH